MNVIDSKVKTKPETLLKQYEVICARINYLDSSYTQTALLFIALIGGYIGVFDKIKGNAIIIAFCLALIAICIIGSIWRLRRLIDQLMIIASVIEDNTFMEKTPQLKLFSAIRTSTYLIVIITIMTTLSIYLTLI